MNAWLFSGSERLHALTYDGEGASLPEDLGPWRMLRTIELRHDMPDEGAAMALIAEHEFCCFE